MRLAAWWRILCRPVISAMKRRYASSVDEGRAAAQEQRIGNRPLEMAMGSLDRAVLMGDAAIVAGRRHAVMGAQRLVAAG